MNRGKESEDRGDRRNMYRFDSRRKRASASCLRRQLAKLEISVNLHADCEQSFSLFSLLSLLSLLFLLFDRSPDRRIDRVLYDNDLFWFAGNVDIVNGNLKLILGLIWSLIEIGRAHV